MPANQDGVLGSLPPMQTGQARSSARTPSIRTGNPTKRVAVVVEAGGIPTDFPNCTLAVHEGTLTVLDANGPIYWAAHGIWKTAYYRDADE